MDNLLYIINGEVNECIIGTNVWIIFNPYHKHCHTTSKIKYYMISSEIFAQC